jgi:hypothetical protein
LSVWRRVENYMLLIVGTVIALIAVVIIPRMRAPSVNARTLGWMSEQWLDEHRASHSP